VITGGNGTRGESYLGIDRLIAVTSVIAAIIFGVAPIKVAYDLAAKGGVPPKSLKTHVSSAVDPLSDIRRAKNDMTIVLKSGDAQVANLRVRQTWLQNTGKAVILPGDMVEPLSISTSAPWRIITVVPSAGARNLVTWTRKSDVEFVTAPTLLNPGDVVWANVYLTKPGDESATEAADKAEEPDPPLEWHARIANLHAITVEPDRKFDDVSKAMGPLFSIIWGWGVPFLLLAFASLASLNLLLFARLGWLSPLKPLVLAAFVGTLLLSLGSAEAATTYVFGLFPYERGAITWTTNIPPMVASLAGLAVLAVLNHRKKRRGT
jgi:hypothetical protein